MHGWAGYAVCMTDSQDDTQQGTSSAHDEGGEGLTPPGGPVPQDGQGPVPSGGGHDDEASASPTNDKHASESGGHTIPIEDEQPHPEPDLEEDAVQQENAETSEDQPSEG